MSQSSLRAPRALAAALLAGLAGQGPAALAATPGARAQVLHVFKGDPDGNYPSNKLLALAGALYGATAYGGTPCAASSIGCGTVFETVPGSRGNIQKILYRFQGAPNDGAVPGSGTLVADRFGALYGTTITGGSVPCNYFGLIGCGIVFKLTPTAKGYVESVVYNFQGGHDGANPVYGLAVDSAGNLYGTTSAGGSKKCPGGGCGVVYKLTLTPSGYVESVIHTFTGIDGAYPDAAPIIDSSGNLYGTTFDGGTGVCPTYGGGCGTAYELTPDRAKYTLSTLYNFQGGADGAQVQSGLLADKKGNLYGMTTFGGDGPCAFTGLPTGCGTIFKLAPSGAGYVETVIHTFQGSDGMLPTGNLYAGANGELYATTPYGGAGACSVEGINGCGTVFALSTAKDAYTQKIIYSFPATGKPGTYPNDPLIDGKSIYVTTCCGSTAEDGALDRIALSQGAN